MRCSSRCQPWFNPVALVLPNNLLPLGWCRAPKSGSILAWSLTDVDVGRLGGIDFTLWHVVASALAAVTPPTAESGPQDAAHAQGQTRGSMCRTLRYFLSSRTKNRNAISMCGGRQVETAMSHIQTL